MKESVPASVTILLRNFVPVEQQTNPLTELCEYAVDLFGPGYDCDGVCLNDSDGDGICDENDDCDGVVDECGNCGGDQTSRHGCDGLQL